MVDFAIIFLDKIKTIRIKLRIVRRFAVLDYK